MLYFKETQTLKYCMANFISANHYTLGKIFLGSLEKSRKNFTKNTPDRSSIRK